ncbi:MAG: ATP-binding protein [Thermoanaerobaculia bacterium]
MKRRRRRRRGGQRRELSILLPVALLLLVSLSTFALFAYRSTVRILIEERHSEAVRLARLLAGELELAPRLDAEMLRRRLPSARAVAVIDELGQLVTATDTRAVAGLRRSLLRGVGAADAGEDVVTGIAYYQDDDGKYAVQVDLAAPVLLSRARGLRVLTPVLLTVNGAVTLLVLILLRQFWAPFEELFARARDAGRAATGRELSGTEDEVELLLEVFDKALAGLAGEGPAAASRRDELETLEVTLARSLQSGVLVCDAGGCLLALNDIGAKLLGIEPPAAGESLTAALSRHPALAELLEQAVKRRREVRRQECTIATAEGERTLGLTVHPLRRADAELRGFLILFADITHARRELAERRLAESLSQLGELTAGIAHELRNSLATLRGYLTLVERTPPGEPIADDLAEIRRESDHLERVLEDFLSFARPGSVRPRRVDLLALVHRVASDPAFGGALVTIDAPPADRGAVPSVQGDPQLLERALRNLVDNAVKAQRGAYGAVPGGAPGVRPPGPVGIRLRRRDGGVEIRIDDHGPGLSAVAAEKLFDPFFTQRPGGVGMGLALTRRIVVLHEGQVAIENRPGGGARATLWIPGGRTPDGKTDTIGNKHGSGPDPAEES